MHKAAFYWAIFVLLAVSFPAIAGDYKLMPDDVIEMNIWREDALSKKQMQISTEGNITVPYLNNIIHASGLTVQGLATAIGEEYIKADILTAPKVEVNLISKHRMEIFVSGQVQKPGKVEFKEGDTIAGAIAQAGSFTPDARLEAATLSRKKDPDKQQMLDLRRMFHDGDMSENYPLEEGDVIYVPEDTYNRFYVLGEVQRPGLYALKDNSSVLSAVSQAGGALPRGSIKGTALVRGDVRRVIDLKKMVGGDQSQDVKLEPGDIVYVPETKSPDWTKISQLIGVITNVGYIRRTGLF